MSMTQQVLTALALYMIIEGMIPFIGPGFFRRNVVRLAQLDDNQLRVVGLMVMLSGLGLLYLIRL